MKEKKYKVYEAADILHQVSNLYLSAAIPIDYDGSGKKFTSTEVHMLKYIIDHPGKNVTQLSKDWDKSKAAISQMLKKLEQKGLVCKEFAADSEKIQLFYATEDGMRLNEAHLKYDDAVFGVSYNKLVKMFSEKDVNMTFQILEAFINIRRTKHFRSKPKTNQKKNTDL
ncbi:MAG: MarR family transcriptional regulator [Coprococcus sp.]